MKTASIYKDLTYNEDKPVISVLMETEFTKEIRIAMQQGTQMKAHKTAFPIVVEVVEGGIDFGVDSGSEKLIKGDIIALEGNVIHDLKANKDSIIRLTLSKLDQADRVKGAV